MRRCAAVFLLLLSSLTLWAENASVSWFQLDNQKKISALRVDLFLLSGCPHCQRADTFFRVLALNNPWIDVHKHIINQDKKALLRFNSFLKAQQSDDFSIPGIFFCDSHWTGFDQPQNSGRLLANWLNYCYQQISTSGTLTSQTISELRRNSNASASAVRITQAYPQNRMVLAMTAVSDVFSICSFLYVVVFLAVLFTQSGRQRLLTGLIFAGGLGVMHFILQGHLEAAQQMPAALRIPVAVTGLLILYTAFRHKILNVLPAAALLGLSLPIYHQTCLPDFALVFQQWLLSQSFSEVTITLLRILYNGIYTAGIALLTMGILALLHRPIFKGFQEKLRIFFWTILLITLVLLIIYPSLPAVGGTVAVLIMPAVLLSWIYAKVLISRR